jgi:hypothetical protein
LAKTGNWNRGTPILCFGKPKPRPRFYRGPGYRPVPIVTGPVTGFLRKLLFGLILGIEPKISPFLHKVGSFFKKKKKKKKKKKSISLLV